MDNVPLLALAVIVTVPALYAVTRIFLYPTTGLCLWVMLLPVTKTIACLAGYRPDEPLGEGPVVLQKLTLGDPVLLLTALGALLNENGPTGRVLDRQGRRIVLLLAAFCGASVVSAPLGETGSGPRIGPAASGLPCASLLASCP